MKKREWTIFLNYTEQKIILCKILEIIYAKNSEQFSWENSEQFYLMQKKKNYECSKKIRIYNKHVVQRSNFINVETDFINAEKQFRLLWNSNMKKHSDLAFKFRKHDFSRCFMRKQWTIF